jgi:hypothetical protein
MKLSNLFFGMAFAAAMLVALGAKAQPVNLTCTSGNQDVRLTFDESAGTAVFGDDPVSNAKFTDTTISWGQVETRNSFWQFHKNYSLNRDTGTLTMYGAQKADNQTKWGSWGGTYRCTVEQKKF